ncbi:M48 family metallopeptidase [Flavihumibacter profundi]|uniref:M48 family metallopeptidase n=1 Tax=Flavihumibacter profundi TaxID=2716883 RepID=UPI001CC50F75|nr:M48 family metallopeptidase [Flavihumibacter profundi]MBZ5856655.1 M48 family metallopeptidase [Flavihumibacter profundi]
MDQSNNVQYYATVKGIAFPVRILLFDQAIQLYDAATQDYIRAFPCNGVKLSGKGPGKFIFALLPDGSQLLEIPDTHYFLPELLKKTGAIKHPALTGLRKLQVPVSVLLVGMAVVGLYYLLVSGIAAFGVQFISPRKEAELGKMIYASIIENEKIDTTATVLINQFAAKLQLSEQYKIVISVVNEKEVNAFAIPGGQVVVYKGILKNLKRPEELVALLCHESSHVNERHSLKNILQEMTGSMVITMVFGDLGSIGDAIIGNANALRSLSYSRGLEKEADELGMQRMLRNQVNPNGMVLLMDRLMESEKGLELPGFLSTHPLTADRKRYARQYVVRNPLNMAQRADINRDWNALEKALDSSGLW